ncbi:hypothetical protein ACP4OV_007956 [Aristida adscensionis]
MRIRKASTGQRPASRAPPGTGGRRKQTGASGVHARVDDRAGHAGCVGDVPGGVEPSRRVPVAGDPVLRDGPFASRYLAFYYFNATAFLTSLLIIILQTNERLYRSEAKVPALGLTASVDLASLAGSSRSATGSIYIILLTCFLVLLLVFVHRRGGFQ